MDFLDRLLGKFCVPDRAIRRGNAVERHVQGGYDLAILEFDDQGWLYDPRQVDELASSLAANQHQSYVVVAFIHGWRHNARGVERLSRAGARTRSEFADGFSLITSPYPTV
ncbi:hypothetical protein [Mesorhizobium sp. WSM3879]|uniref:hypothetical protein n=1 Tax=Mesorhizobium sp. WSM3879 TaxID=2029406 RepID=UPI00117C0DFF|nr:hypothetical protein [Mesorhizobium sp. WSM3879]